MQRTSYILKSAGIIGTAILLHTVLKAQNPRSVPPPYSATLKKSYVRTFDAVKPGLDGNTIITQQTKDVRRTTQYVDGLGRPLQTVIKEGSLETSTGVIADLVTATEYNSFGKEQFKYLPFVSTTADGNFKLDPFQQQAAYMSAQYATQGETFFYGETKFENSPLNRVDETFAAGNNWSGTAWQAAENNRRSIKIKYWLNTITDNVQKWDVTSVVNGWGNYTATAAFAASQLYKNVTVDEHGKQVIEFKDKEGKILLKKVQLTAVADNGSGSNHSGWLCTYYIYDELNNLRCVIQPEAVKNMSNAGNWTLTTTILNEQCFRYEYDDLNRMVMKKVPGAGEVWMVYDARDRLVLTQDTNLRAQGKWMYTLYDFLNRPEITGLWNNTQNRLYHKPLAEMSSNYPSLSGQTIEELTRTFYDNYTWLASWGNPLPSSFTSTFNPYLQTESNSTWPYPQTPATHSIETIGLATGMRIKVIGTSTYLFTVNFYDNKGRMIQVHTQNTAGGVDVATTQYTWSGQPLVMVSKTEKASPNAQTSIIVTQMTYDDLWRLTKTEKKLSNTLVNGSAMSAYKTINENQYDKAGQLKKKKLAPAHNAGSGIETLDYDYNIRGWMLGMNRNYLADGATGKWFGFELGYDKLSNFANRNFTAGQYSGNINGMIWKSRGDAVRRKYDFSYDAANRLLQGLFEQNDAGSAWGSSTMNYTIKMGNGIDPLTAYDCNGNITGMTQFGWKPGISSTTPIDNLAYTYISGTNKLLKVVDAVSDPNTKLGDFKDGSNGSTDDYTYDANGNLTLDNNKAISSITYNYLNLPTLITITGKGAIAYTYDAAGNKLKKLTTDNTVVPAKITTTLYSGGAVYENDVMQFIGHEEGRIRFTPVQGAVPAKFDFDYMLKDHLGNVRMVLTDEIKSDAYPTLSFEGTSGTTEVINQDASWENANGLSINVVGVRIGRPSAMGTSSTNGSYVRSIKKSTGAIGATKLLKVMAGDRIHTSVDYFYIATNASNGTANPLNSFVTSLISSFSASTQISGQIKNEVSTITSQLSVNSAFTSAINPAPNTSGSNQAPKAYLNVLFFDDQFKFDATSSVVVKVAYSPNVKQTIDRKFSNALTAGKSGYVYIYFSNESESPVHFDNFMLTHERSSLIEETHYYPFGLTMAGISSKALAFGNPKNKKGYNGNELQSGEFSDGSGLEFYDFNARSYDQQIGRFMQIDPLSDTVDQSSLGPFQFSYNNPVRYGDPSGKCPCLIPALVWLGKAAVAAYVAYKATEAAKPLIDEVVRSVEDKLPEIKIDPENKVDRDLLNPPSKPGNAPTYKEDGKSIEIHHDGQNPEGPFKEMHPEEHRGKGNFKKNHSNTGQEPSKIDRKEWNKKVREYWQKEYDKRKLIEGTPEIT